MRNASRWAVAAVALSATAVAAQERPLLVQPYGLAPSGPNYGFDYGQSVGYPGMPIDALPTPFSHGGSCVKMCKFDQSPCDPDYWKVADRRCNYNQRG